ncbi:hypothetical protein LVD15_20920 [Fulvivirga maritima]|uniref:hypothetical protein n=1 Tax=Fulvivirga maritima TaxID=2904247 RepID=UPI001F31F070|nr:hypothetical protein [Fulvivirga maritima]UII25746.1 hypothetical protein LVD15_20920 [Fulvivirga maritima]
MTREQELIQIHEYAEKLKQVSLEIRSKLTSVILSTESREHLTDTDKDSILQLCDLIKFKDDELVSVEGKLLETVDRLKKERVTAHI